MMYHRKSTAAAVSLTLLFALLLASCTGNGSSGSSTMGGVSLSPLIVADRVSVVDPQGGSSKPAAKAAAPTGIKSLLVGLNIISNPLSPTTDYMLDVPTIYVNERSTEAFSDINSILCSVKQTRYDAMINQGPYLALVDEKRCRNEASNSTEQSSDTNIPEYRLWTVKSSRANETAPHIVDVWLIDSYQDPERPNGQLITAQMIITEGADTAPPYGKFQINYYTVDPTDHSIEINRGLLRSMPNPQTGEALLQFAEETPSFSFIKKATLEKRSDDTGGGTVLEVGKDDLGVPTTTRFDIAFNTDYFLRHNYDATPDICLDRLNFYDSAWRYGLYDQSGMRVNVNSGFTIKRGSEYGWVGYWGFWLPANADGTPGTVTNNETVYQHDFSTNVDIPYTVFQAKGKLKRHTRKPLTLGDIRNIPLYWWNSGPGCAVVWDGTQFDVFAEQDPTGVWGPVVNCPDVINLSTLYSTELNFWSESVGGQMRVPLSEVTSCNYNPTNGYANCSGFNILTPLEKASTPVIYYAENIVYPGETVPAALACFDNCPIPADANGIDPTTTIAFYNTWDYTNGTSTKHDYTFDPVTMLLKDTIGPYPVVLSSASADPNYQWGVGTGALFDANLLTQTNPDTGNLYFACSFDPTKVCGWQAWSELSEFYTWETGPNSWNMFTGLKDSSGAFVRFDPPLRVMYVHSQPDPTAPDYKYNQVKFNLEYNGFGNLSGIPGVCVDMNMQPASCGPDTRWVPEFTIPDDDGAGNLTEVSGGTSWYIVKALEKEQRMQDATGLCAGITSQPYPLPSMTLWRQPTSGPEPTITSAPKVIGGEVQ